MTATATRPIEKHLNAVVKSVDATSRQITFIASHDNVDEGEVIDLVRRSMDSLR
jgi:hypothetical protein